MARTTVQTRVGTVSLMMLLLVLGGVALARSRPQPGSRPENASSFRELTTAPFDPAEAAPVAATWFRITFEWVRADGTSPLALADAGPAPSSQENLPVASKPVQVPEAVQNLRRADR